jgi:hypothetical protein
VASTDYISGIISTGNNGGWGLCYDPTSNIQGYWVDASGSNGASSKENTKDVKIVTGLVGKTTDSYIYTNSQLKGNRTAQSVANGLTDNIYVGVRGNASNRKFIGNISEVFMFPKTLSAAEQTALETSQSIFVPQSPVVTITSSASGAVCAGTNVTFTASVSGISSPTYQWYKNGVAISGATSLTYSTTTLNNNDQIYLAATPAVITASLITSNLISNVDAGNSSSYSGTGGTWTDLTGKGNKVTFTGSGYSTGAGYTSVNGGGILFNTSKYGTQTVTSPPFSGDFTWSTILKAPDPTTNGWDFIYNVGGYNGFNIGLVSGQPRVSWGSWFTDNINVSGEALMITGNYYMLTYVRSGNTLSCYLQANRYGTSGTVLGGPAAQSPFIGRGPGGESWENGIMNVLLLYNRALTQSEIAQNYNTYASRFGFTAVGISSNTISTTISPAPSSSITVNGDGCINKTSLTTTSGLTSYVWYKDNVIISGITTNALIPNAIGDYKVVVTNGSCSNTSSATTIYNCGINADGKAVSIANTGSLISREGGAYLGTAKDLTGKMFNTTSLTTIGASSVGTTSVVLGGIISGTNGRSSGIGVVYSTDPNFGSFLTTSISTNVAAGTYTSTISGLASSTKYYAKSFIVNASGTNYGSVVDFTTTTPTIVTNGLILYLNANSYSSGNTWSDLSTQNNNATLVGSPTFSSNPNSFTLASNKYALTSNLISSLSSATFIAWVNPSETQADYTGIIFSRGPNSGASAPATGMNFFRNNSVGYSWNDNGSTWGWDSRLQTPVNSWSMIAITISSNSATAYLCKASGITTAVNTVAHSALTGLKFYVGAEPFDINTRAMKGKISTAMIYSSALSLSDITSIFNAQKASFGL